jgi:hypothetical protein
MCPALPYQPWRATCEALHLYCQIVGKYRLARTPWVNHSWHATLYVTPEGLTTGLVPDGPEGAVEIAFDLRRHVLRGTSGARAESFPLGETTATRFHARFRELVSALGGDARFDGRPNEMAQAVPFARDGRPRPYDEEAVARFHRALVFAHDVFQRFRTGFLGKASPVHLFWGSFDLAVTRFSGRRAPLHPGGIPNLPDAVTREAYSHEVSSAGFWPGGGGLDEPAFYSYAYPAPEGFSKAGITPDAAYFHTGLGEFILPYEAVRAAPDPQAVLMGFLRSTYDAAATLGRWDRAALDCAIGEPGRPRAV